jgi:nucleoside-diphosphate-sugar epimerase
MRMRVLVTGSKGFVGRHMVEAFQRRGDTVLGMDLVDGNDMVVAMRSQNFAWALNGGFDLVVHCAAHVKGREEIDGSPLAVGTNLALDSIFFRWLELAGVPRAVYFSSSAAYPAATQNAGMTVDLSEDMAARVGQFFGEPDATYGWAKLTGEILAEHARARGHEVLVVRPFSGYGEDQSLDYPFPSFIARAARRDDPFQIWGDGEQVRDFVHIDDVVGATLALLDAGEQGPVNIGTGRPTSFNQLAEMVVDEVGGGYRPRIEHLPAKPVGVRYRVADTTRLRRFYQPRISLEQGVEQALRSTRWTGKVVSS